MAESDAHKRAKSKAAGPYGETEVPLDDGRRVDAITSGRKRATEIERNGTPLRLEKAAERLRDTPGLSQRVLQVPQKDMRAAARAMKDAGVSGTVKNLGGTRRRSVRGAD